MRTFRTLGIVGSTAALLLSSSVVFAQTPTTGAVPTPSAPVPPSASAQPRFMPVGVINTEKGALRERAQATTSEETKAAMEARREGAKNLMEAKREEAKTKVEAQREKAAQRLANIQDKVKKEMADKMAGQFGELNKTWTDHFMELLGRYDEVLQKIQDRADIAAGAGKDITAVTASLQSARTAIDAARTAVIAQAAKTYVLDPSTIPTTATTTASGQEKILQNLRNSFKSLHASLFKDLFALRDGPMTGARKAVQSAFQALGQVPGVDEGNATTTAASNQ